MDSLAGTAKTTRLLGCLGVAAVLALTAGCGTSTEKVIDSSTATPVIEKQIRTSGFPAAKSIHCPQTKPKVGATFGCHVTLRDGAAYLMGIRVDKAGAQHPLLTVVASKLITVGPSNVRPLIDEQLRETKAPKAKAVTCQPAPAKVGGTFTCEATLADGRVLTDSFRVLKVSPKAAPEFSIKALGIE